MPIILWFKLRKCLWILILVLLWAGLTGWNFSRHSIPLAQIEEGGPPKDGIPALLHPRFVVAEVAEQEFLGDSDRVIGITRDGKSKAYPIKILNWHEIVNDRISGHYVVVTFCPLCGTGMVFDANSHTARRTFGVSGLLYQSDMLLYDHQTESLWSQIKSEAVTGPLMGTRLKLLASTQANWKHWKQLHPDTMVLSTRTGYARDYDQNPYGDYASQPELFFNVRSQDSRYHPKEQVLGVEWNGKVKAYPFSELARASLPVQDQLGGSIIGIDFDPVSKTAVAHDSKGHAIPSVTGFWFAWIAFHPKTEVFVAPHKK